MYKRRVDFTQLAPNVERYSRERWREESEQIAEELTVNDMSRDAVSVELRSSIQLSLHGNLATRLDVAALAQLSAMNAPVLCGRFRASFGMTPIQYQRRLRMQEARRLLLTDRLDVAAVRSRVGYYRPLEFVRGAASVIAGSSFYNGILAVISREGGLNRGVGRIAVGL